MKIALISLHKNSHSYEHYLKTIPYNLYVIKAKTPKTHKVQIIENPKLISNDFNLYCFSLCISNYKETYKISNMLKKKGKTVIFGGPWVTKKTKESMKYCSSIVIGEVEEKWKKILEDFESGCLEKEYHCNPVDLQNFPIIKRPYSSYFEFNNFILSTRGCPHKCSFCDMNSYTGKKLRSRSPNDIVKELKLIQKNGKGFFKKIVYFVDQNIYANPEHAKELFRKMIGLNLAWFSHCTIDIALDDEALDLAYKSGCRGLFFGYESIEKENLKVIKPQNYKLDYKELTRKIVNKKILVFGTFIFGLENDTKETFNKTLKFALNNNIILGNFHVLRMIPGTDIYNKLQKEKKISKNKKYFIPKNFNYSLLVKNAIMVNNSFFSFANTIKKFKYLIKHHKLKYCIFFLFVSLFAKKSIVNNLKSLQKEYYEDKIESTSN